MVMECIQASVFGNRDNLRKLDCYQNGVLKKLSIGEMLRYINIGFFRRNLHPVRLVTKCFDRMYINAEEREMLRNIRTMREFVRVLIRECKEEIKDGTGATRGDFISFLIREDFFKDDEEKMLDESFLFLIAST